MKQKLQNIVVQPIVWLLTNMYNLLFKLVRTAYEWAEKKINNLMNG